MFRRLTGPTILALLLALASCKSAYYAAWDKMGWAKRDILVDRVKEAKSEQEGAKKEFKNALEQFQALTGFQGGDLEAKYKKLNSEYEPAKAGQTVSASASRRSIPWRRIFLRNGPRNWANTTMQNSNAQARRNSAKPASATTRCTPP